MIQIYTIIDEVNDVLLNNYVNKNVLREYYNKADNWQLFYKDYSNKPEDYG